MKRSATFPLMAAALVLCASAGAPVRGDAASPATRLPTLHGRSVEAMIAVHDTVLVATVLRATSEHPGASSVGVAAVTYVIAGDPGLVGREISLVYLGPVAEDPPPEVGTSQLLFLDARRDGAFSGLPFGRFEVTPAGTVRPDVPAWAHLGVQRMLTGLHIDDAAARISRAAEAVMREAILGPQSD